MVDPWEVLSYSSKSF